MKRLNTQKGFTLVELAIVMTIIGLLIGGILKGQELMENARVTATAAQIKAFEAATTSFRDVYQAYPGDMKAASTRLAGCPSAAICDPLITLTTTGDGVVGDPLWASAGWALQDSQTTGAATTAVADETYLFWMHLLLANLINGVNTSGATAATPFAWGVTHPAAKIGGGFTVGYDNGTKGLGSAQTTSGLSGTIVAMQLQPGVVMKNTANTQVVTPLRAAQLDRKMDDGAPATGYVQAYGLPASCTLLTAGNYVYAETVANKDCGLLFRIQG